LSEGVHAVVTLGALRVLVKVRMALDVSVWKLATGELGVCGGCKSQLLWPASTTLGALIPCPECGDLNSLREGSDEPGPHVDEQDQSQEPAGFHPESMGPDTSAFDDDDEATELESIPSSSPSSGPAEQLPPFSVEAEVGANAPPLPLSEAEDECPTDPGRDVPEIAGPTMLPPPQIEEPRQARSLTPTVDGVGFAAEHEPSLVPDLPLVAGAPGPTGNEFLAPRRRRPPPKPNYKGWGLVFFGMLSGLAGLVLLLLSALRL